MLVGDFVWPGFDSEVVAADHVFAALESSFAGFERGPIEMVDEPDLDRDGQPRVSLPYEGPALYELWTTAWASADVERSTMRMERRCGTCGTEFWEVDGGGLVEHRCRVSVGVGVRRIAETPARNDGPSSITRVRRPKRGSRAHA